MKKIIGVLLSFSMILALLIPVSSVSAYTGGILHGKTLTGNAGTTSNITDGDSSTSFSIGYNYYLGYVLPEAKDITHIRSEIKSGLTDLEIYFYSSTNVTLGVTHLTAGDNTLTVDYKDVKSITIQGTNVTIYELDFFAAGTNPDPGTDPGTDPGNASGNRAILTITMTNGLQKEYDLPIATVNDFIYWYDTKDAGSGPAKYKFTKSWNKGPFKTRSEYVIFDKILTFDVDEYDVVNP